MKKKHKIIIGVVLVLWLLPTFTNNKDTELADNEPSTQTEIETQTESEVETEVVETEPEINVDELSEEEYKAICELITDDEEVPLKEKLFEGQHVKMQVRVGDIYTYEKYDTFGIIIDDLIEEYDLERFYYKAFVLHTGFSGPTLSVYGDHVYLLFDNASLVSSDDIEPASDVVIYGEVVQMWSGPFVIPRYIETVE